MRNCFNASRVLNQSFKAEPALGVVLDGPACAVPFKKIVFFLNLICV